VRLTVLCRCIIAVVIIAIPATSRGVVSRRWPFGAGLARALLLKVTGAVQALGPVRYAAVVSSVSVCAAALAKHGVAGLLVTIEQFSVGVPALPAVVVALPGTQLLGLGAGTTFTSITITPRLLLTTLVPRSRRISASRASTSGIAAALGAAFASSSIAFAGTSTLLERAPSR
jgi:hypothetical protein